MNTLNLNVQFYVTSNAILELDSLALEGFRSGA